MKKSLLLTGGFYSALAKNAQGTVRKYFTGSGDHASVEYKIEDAKLFVKVWTNKQGEDSPIYEFDKPVSEISQGSDGYKIMFGGLDFALSLLPKV